MTVRLHPPHEQYLSNEPGQVEIDFTMPEEKFQEFAAQFGEWAQGKPCKPLPVLLWGSEVMNLLPSMVHWFDEKEGKRRVRIVAHIGEAGDE